MPEGPSIVILKDLVESFAGKKITEAYGNAKFDKTPLINKKIIRFASWGKHFLISVKGMNLRIHFLLFGSYSINEQTKPDKSLRLCLKFKEGSIYFYTCAIKVLEKELDEEYDWQADVMNEDWNAAAAKKKLKSLPETLVCDALLDQNIFAGVGNIIKNEVLYRIKLHPENRIADIPLPKLNALIKEARIYSFQFLDWKKAYVLKKNWLAHTKRTCKRCDLPFTKQHCGKTNRRSFYCENCQTLYSKPIERKAINLKPVVKKVTVRKKALNK